MKLGVRTDLKNVKKELDTDGNYTYIIHDPVNEKYHHLPQMHFELLRRLDGNCPNDLEDLMARAGHPMSPLAIDAALHFFNSNNFYLSIFAL